MYSLSVALEVNPPGSDPVLSRSDVWNGLVMKTHDPMKFVPSMESCAVLDRWDGGLVRQIQARGERFTERITFTPEVQVLFEREDDAGRPAGWITNVISDSERGLMLTFTFSVAVADGDLAGDAMKASYIAAIETTLRTVRRLVGEGMALH